MISTVRCTCSKTKPALNFLADGLFLSSVATVTICLTTILHAAEEEVKPVYFDTTVGWLTGSSAPRWLKAACGEGLHQKDQKRTRYAQILVQSSYKTQSCVSIFPNVLFQLYETHSPVLVPTSAWF